MFTKPYMKLFNTQITLVSQDSGTNYYQAASVYALSKADAKDKVLEYMEKKRWIHDPIVVENTDELFSLKAKSAKIITKDLIDPPRLRLAHKYRVRLFDAHTDPSAQVAIEKLEVAIRPSRMLDVQICMALGMGLVRKKTLYDLDRIVTYAFRKVEQ